MKNPYQVPARESWFPGTWDLAEREFCAHAINLHEKLVGLLRVCDPILKGGATASLRSKVRREIAALLAEEPKP